MTETAQNALIPRVINGLVDVIVKECTYVCNFQKNVQNVSDKVKELQGMEDNVEQEIYVATKRGKRIGDDIELWGVKVSSILSKYDDVLKGTSKVNSGFMKGRLNVPQRFLLSRKAAQLYADIVNVLAEGQKHVKLNHVATIMSADLESRVILMEQVMSALTNDEIYMIGICGTAGVGKTRLADEVKRRVIEEKLFDSAVKVDVSQVPNISDIQGVIALSLGLDLNVTNGDGRASKLLSRLTDGSKNLVILDNIWDRILLDKIGIPFQGEEKGCKLVFTSRNIHLPWIMKAEKFEVLPLSTREARLLFKEIAGACVEDIANNIADECGGLPLAIDAVASALCGRNVEVWERALNQLRESTATKESGKLITLHIKLSYDLLVISEPEAQPLLLLCCLFPEGADIPHQKLVRYVKGLKLLSSSDNLMNTSTRVFELLGHLKNHSLLLRGEKETSVKMNHVVRDVCLSISSEEDKNRFKVKHKPKLMQWPDEEKQRSYTGISLTFDDQMQRLPVGLSYPELALLQLQFHSDSLNMPADFFNGMRDIKVLDFKRMTLWGRFILIDGLPPILQFLTNLRTLCMEFCDLSSGDLSLIESLKRLEVLSFFSSKLGSLPLQIQQLTNLKLLDLRCADGPLIIPSNLLPSLMMLEELYLGNYDSWSSGTAQSVQGQGVNITELSSLSLLKVLQVRVKDPQVLLELNEESWFKGLKNFQIAAIRKILSFHEYEVGKSITFDGMDWSSFIDAKISLLLSTTQCLTLKATRFENLFGMCPNLQTLDLYGGDEVKFIMDKGDSSDALNNLKRLKIQSMDDLEVICNGELPSKSLTNLESVKLDSLPQLTQLWMAPVGSECLGNLRVLEMSYCDAIICMFPFSVAEGLVRLERLDIKRCEMLQWIFSEGEGGHSEKLVLQKMNFISLDDLPNFRSFSPDFGVKTLTVEDDPFESEKGEYHKTQGCGWFTRKYRAPVPKQPPANEDPVIGEDNVECTTEPLFNHQVELPSMKKLMVRSMDYLKHIVNDQTSKVSVSKIRIMHVVGCAELLSLAASEYSIRCLHNLEQVNVKNCKSMQAMFDFGTVNVENPSADPMLNKLETVILLNLNNLKHVFLMVPEGTPCFKNLKSLEISSCGSLNYVFSVSAAKMLGNLRDLKVKGSNMVEEIIEIDRALREETNTIQFAQLRILQLENLDRLVSFSSGNHDFEFPKLQDLLIRECPSMDKFCRGKVTARKLDQVRVGEHHDQQVSIKGGLNATIQQLNVRRVQFASSEIQEV